jgi:hypothetical protein
MPKFRILGGKQVSYWTMVDAEDSYEALDKAEELNSIDWIEIEQDNTIEPYEVFEEDNEEEEFQFDSVNVIGETDEATR